MLKIIVSPIQNKLHQYVHQGTKFYNLICNTKALYNLDFDLAYELIF
ncbi:hypothetical protein ACQVQY_12130 [Bacillus mycoides]|nr:hypothetical protein [Bacillus mycoides]QWI74691.1 hypothetical protein JG486_22475 [Bacillus mycoides]